MRCPERGDEMKRRHLTERARRFLREVGSIVLGVLIALAIGEAADSVRHRVNASRALAAIREEYGVNGVYIEERMLKGRCIAKRLEAVRTALATARATGRLQPIVTVGAPNIRPLTTAAWQTFLGSGDTLYASPQTIGAGRLYEVMADRYRDMQDREQEAWARLRVLEGRTGPVDGDLMVELEITIEEARYNARLINVLARQLRRGQQDLGVSTNYASIDRPFPVLVNEARSNPMCRPL